MFGRVIRVHVAGLVIDDIRVTTTVRRSSDPTQDTGKVNIINLAEGREDQIYQRADGLVLEAGYRGAESVIFDGPVQRVLRDRTLDNVARVTQIVLGDSTHAPAMAGGVTVRSYAGTQSVRGIVRDLAGDLGLAVGPLDMVPASATLHNWSHSGTTKAALAQVLRSAGCSWFEDDGVLRARRVGAPAQADAPAIVLNQSTGLVGAPTRTDEGAEVTMLLNPNVRLGSRITLGSVKFRGDWIVTTLEHEGDNWEGRFTTWADLREAA